ncbi:IPT/TIG domain-containing protein [bacterium]|nr:IPT/TIG domain-containing protein [bacterium]
MLNRVLLLTFLAIFLAGCGGGGTSGIGFQPGDGNGKPETPKPSGPIGSDHVQGDGMALDVIRDASGVPIGVKVSWTRVNDAKATGYWIYRDTSSLPSGDPAGQQSKRITAQKIDQSGTGTQTLTFDDVFNPPIGNTYFYRMTVVNDTSDESDFSNQLSITIAQHTLTGFTPAGGGIGTEVTINGTNFGQTQNGDKVFFTNSTGSTNVEATTVTSWSSTQIKVLVPYGASTGPIGVKVGTVQVNSAASFDYTEPNIVTVNPTEDWVQNQYITLSGNDFGPPPSTGGSNTQVYFGTAQAQLADFDEANWTTSQIKVKVPAAAVGKTVTVKVVVAGNESNTPNFILLPHIDSLSTTSGNTGSSLILTGTNFGSTQGTSTVTVNGVTASVSSWANGSITCTIPAAAVDGNVVVNRDDSKVSNGIGFDVVPTISSLTPSRRVIGENLTINGSGFGDTQSGSVVRFLGGSGVDATTIVSWANNQIVVTVPTGASTGQVRVTVNDASVGANLDQATSSGNVAVVLTSPNLTGVGQI